MRDLRPLARDLLSGLSLLTHPFRAALCRVFRRAPRAAVASDRVRALDLAARRRALMDELRTDSIRRRGSSAPIELAAFGDRLARPHRGTLCDTPFAVHPILVEDGGDWLAGVGGSLDFGGADSGSTPSRTED